MIFRGAGGVRFDFLAKIAVGANRTCLTQPYRADHHPAMKWFLGVCAFIGVVGIGLASCGPKKDFCPTKPPDFICFFEDGGPMGGAGGQDQGPCDGGPQMFCQNGTPVCSLSQCN
jgi:hypothetical protein